MRTRLKCQSQREVHRKRELFAFSFSSLNTEMVETSYGIDRMDLRARPRMALLRRRGRSAMPEPGRRWRTVPGSGASYRPARRCRGIRARITPIRRRYEVLLPSLILSV